MTVQLANIQQKIGRVSSRKLWILYIWVTTSLFLMSAETGAQVAQAEMETAEHCVPSVNFTGDKLAIHEVREALKRLNLSPKLSMLPKDDCATMAVELKKEETAYKLKITAPQIPAYERKVAHAETVAVLLDAFLFRAPQVSRADRRSVPAKKAASQSKPAPGKQFIPNKKADSPVDKLDSYRHGLIFEAAMFPEITVAFDRSVWFGGDFSGCVRLGKICIGPNIRFAIDILDAGKTKDSELHRTLLNVTLKASFHLWQGPFVLVPGIGVGGGWTFVEEKEEPEDVHHVFTGFRVEAYLLGTAIVNDRWSIGIGVSTGVSVPAQTNRYSADDIDISEPRGMFRVGFGASYRFGGGINPDKDTTGRGKR